ncbi:MAG: hypothetical protein GY856_22295, partial [bacterium]|nr:hypothetical protein [bacterium]
RLADVAQILRELLEALRIPGLVARVLDVDDDPGYQLNASGMVWRAGDGTAAFHDPVRVPNAPAEGLQPNPFFKDFYRAPAAGLEKLRAREHTAQVPQEERIDREDAFGEARLPVLFCSPTMELGVDIRELNVVGLRNVPPTPANYAQRSGRAGRGGQPAFVFAYCSAGSPHDRYFFKRPELMVTGSVTTPRLDLANQDLLRAHVHAMYLREARLELGSSLADVLELGGEEPALELKDEVREKLLHEPFRTRTRDRALAALGKAIGELPGHDGDPRAWLDAVLGEIPRSFERACERWRTLYRAAFHQARQQGRIATDASRDPRDRDQAKRLRAEAERQLELLLYRSRDGDLQADFYSYRYFASEGFLPGYSFPRLPLSAYLPGRKSRLSEDDDFLSRPRFLAISEFGPRSIIYHEGSRYEVNRAILPLRDEARPITHRAVQCASCGYLHILSDETRPDVCEQCDEELPAPYTNLFKLQNASTRRRDRINSDEEERRRLGYEIKTGVRFSERAGRSSRSAVLRGGGGEELARLEYGAAATVWRLNLGERRRGDRQRLGYQLDV